MKKVNAILIVILMLEIVLVVSLTKNVLYKHNTEIIETGITFDKKEYIELTTNSLKFPNNFSVVSLGNISVDSIEQQTDSFSYIKSITIKDSGWHLISTDIYSTIYLDGFPLIHKINQSVPNYTKRVINIQNDGEYTIVDTKIFLTSKWIMFDGNWTTIEFYIGDFDDIDREFVDVYKVGKLNHNLNR